MATRKVRPTVFHGRLRTSTLVLLAVFVGLLVLYAWVRPQPASPVAPSRAPATHPTPTVLPVP
jgi:hypothetical protein